MSYTTRCPACGTMFRVVPDQLKISDGWVRCGHCADVFDATLYLEEWTPPPVPQSSSAPETAETAATGAPEADLTEPLLEPGPESEPVMSDVTAMPEATEPVQVDVDALPSVDGQQDAHAEASPAEHVEAHEWLVLPQAQPDTNGAADDAWDASPTPLPETASVWDSQNGDVQVQDPAAPLAAVPEDDFQTELARFAAAAGRPPAPAPAVAAPEPAPPPVAAFSEPDEVAALHEADEPGFMRQARRQAFWQAPGVRAVLALLALLLSVLLAAQWALHERDRLAASQPGLAPLLAQLCEPLGCTLAPVRQIDAVVIDSSTLARRLGNFYAFDVVIKNTAAIPVAVPALELSLTDTRDQVIARRVFLPAELPGAPALLPAQGSAPLSLRLSITDVGAVPMAGYRALVFYP